jgi:microcystin degradation protein MlrC
MRVGILSIQHESNTFVDTPTTLQDFARDVLARGEEVRRVFQEAHHELGGFFQGLSEANLEAVPLFAARAAPGGTVAADTYATLLNTALSELAHAPALDGLLLAPHGAGVSANAADMDSHWLTAVRERVGQHLPIIGTLDPHANLSAAMAAACNALIAYRTNPHVDQRLRGLEAARLIARVLRGEARPTQRAAFPPVAIGISCQQTDSVPCCNLIAAADAQLADNRVLSNSVILGFPYADVVEMGSAFVVVTDNDSPRAQRLADALAYELVRARHEFVCRLPGVEEAVAEALDAPAPTCLLDVGDNVGGGAPGDGTQIARELLRRGVSPSFVSIFDPEAVEAAASAAPGAQLNLRVGGKSTKAAGTPIELRVRVLSVHDGNFTELEPRHGGRTHYSMGLTAIVRAEGLTIQLHSQRIPPFSLKQIESCGLDPATFRVIVAKGVNAPIAAYRSVCRSFIRVNTSGVTTGDMTRAHYHRRRRPLFPFEEISVTDQS